MSTFARDIAYSDSPAASRVSASRLCACASRRPGTGYGCSDVTVTAQVRKPPLDRARYPATPALGVVAAGLCGFGLYSLADARYRRV